MQTQNLAVGYARVSREGEDVGNQVHVIDDYAKTNNLTLVGVFNDVEGFKLKLGDSMLKMSGETSGSIYRDVFISVLVGSVLSFVLQQLNSSGLPIPSSVNVFQYVYPMHLPTPEEIEVIVGLLMIIISLIMLIRSMFKRQTTDEDWD
jgi:Resolvase, N terminal domain.